MKNIFISMLVILRYTIIGVIALFIVGYLAFNSNSRKAMPSNSEQDLYQWEITKREDKIRNTSYTIYSINSLNSFELKFPYNGIQRASLDLVQYGGEWASAAFKIEKGHFACQYDFSQDNPCTFKVKFGNNSVESFIMEEAPDNTDQIKIFKNSKLFIDRLKQVQSIVIEVVINEAGVYQFEFEWKHL